MSDVPEVRSNEEFVAWLDRVIAGLEADLAAAQATVARLGRALPEFRRARRIFDGTEPVPPAPPAGKHSCPHCPRSFASGAGLGGHLGKAHPGAKRAAQAEKLSRTVIDHADVAPALDAALARATAPVGLRELSEAEKADNTTDGHCPVCNEYESECECGDEPAPAGALRCPLNADDGGTCRFDAEGDPGQLDRHLRRRHRLCAGYDADDVEYRADQVRKAQADAGLPATWGL